MKSIILFPMLLAATMSYSAPVVQKTDPRVLNIVKALDKYTVSKDCTENKCVSKILFKDSKTPEDYVEGDISVLYNPSENYTFAYSKNLKIHATIVPNHIHGKLDKALIVPLKLIGVKSWGKDYIVKSFVEGVLTKEGLQTLFDQADAVGKDKISKLSGPDKDKKLKQLEKTKTMSAKFIKKAFDEGSISLASIFRIGYDGRISSDITAVKASGKEIVNTKLVFKVMNLNSLRMKDSSLKTYQSSEKRLQSLLLPSLFSAKFESLKTSFDLTDKEGKLDRALVEWVGGLSESTKKILLGNNGKVVIEYTNKTGMSLSSMFTLGMAISKDASPEDKINHWMKIIKTNIEMKVNGKVVDLKDLDASSLMKISELKKP